MIDNSFTKEKRKIFMAELKQETNTFLPVPTPLDNFKVKNKILSGNKAVIDTYAKTNTVIGGFISGCNKHEIEPIISLVANAEPGGVVKQSAYEKLRGVILSDLKKQQQIDGVVISLHGSMVAEECDDPEGDILQSIRDVIGNDIPIVGVLDLHANVTQTMTENADVLLVYKTYPHVDTEKRGLEAIDIVCQIIMKSITPTMHWVRIPALLISLNMRTTIPDGPMTEMIKIARDIEKSIEVLDISVAGGFPYADIPTLGAGIICTTNNNRELAQSISKDLAEKLWNIKEKFLVDLLSPEEALNIAIKSKKGPIVLADVSDNPQSGGSGDTTGLLKAAMDKKVQNILFSIFYDPETVKHAIRIGEGGTSGFSIGGKVYPQHGEPCELMAKVIKISDGSYTHMGPMNYGVKGWMGNTVVLEVINDDIVANGGSFVIVASERRMSTNDPEMLRSLGIRPENFKILALKSKGHFRAAFEPIVEVILDVDTPGFSSLNLRNYSFSKITRPVWPLDDISYPG